VAEDEKYLELYKRHKPKVWKDLIGQRGIVGSLKAAVKSNRLPVAFLFSGPRGCGKTSAAKVLASAINCLNEKANLTGDACGICEVCVNIQNDAQLGVNYISMANKGGVDEVRKIVEQARLAQPVKRTIWILDEVHNLSPAAWDSLLIPIESNRMPSLFIFCSTEAHKIPDTILSRIQPRAFKLVPEDVLRPYLEAIAKADELSVQDGQIEAAIRTGRGSVRDTLTALESILSTGEFDESLGESLLLSLQNADVIEMFKVIGQYAGSGEKMRYLAEDLYSDLRDLLLLRTKGGEELVTTAPLKDVASFKAKVPANQHLAMLDAVGDTVTAMSVGAADHRIILEAALLKSVQRLKRAARATEEG
jgi:DNA polymerase-3 subunit gamma/tau